MVLDGGSVIQVKCPKCDHANYVAVKRQIENQLETFSELVRCNLCDKHFKAVFRVEVLTQSQPIEGGTNV